MAPQSVCQLSRGYSLAYFEKEVFVSTCIAIKICLVAQSCLSCKTAVDNHLNFGRFFMGYSVKKQGSMAGSNTQILCRPDG